MRTAEPFLPCKDDILHEDMTSISQEPDIIYRFPHISFTLTILMLTVVTSGCKRAAEHLNEDPAFTSEIEVPDPHELIGIGRIDVDVMQLWVPSRFVELSGRFTQAIRANPAWWLQHSKRMKPGEPLPWDKRMGLSMAEYDEFIELGEKRQMKKSNAATLIVIGRGDNVYELDGGASLPTLTGIQIDLERDEIRTAYGVAINRSATETSADSPLGRWIGVKWSSEDVNPKSGMGTTVTFELARLHGSGRCVLYYRVRRAQFDENTRISNVLIYDMPPR